MSSAQQARLREIRKRMKQEGMDCLALVPGSSLDYVVGGGFFLLERPFITFIPADDAARLVVVLPELEAPAWDRSSPFEAQLCPWTDEEGPADAMRQAAAALEGVQALGVEHLRMRVQERDLICRFMPGVRLAKGENALEPVRVLKDSTEIASFRRAVQALEGALESVLSTVRPGISEREICSSLTRAVLHQGGEMVSIEPLVQSGPNTAMPHGRTGDRRIQSGDILLIDFTTTVHGYYADMTRSFVVGREPDDRQRKVYEAVQDANAAGRGAVRPHATCQDIDRAARQAIIDAGLGEYFIHRTGHGLGLDVHEAPNLVEGNLTPLEEGMVFTVEPGVYIEGWGGVRIEDNVTVTSDGVECLTSFDRDLRVVGT